MTFFIMTFDIITLTVMTFSISNLCHYFVIVIILRVFYAVTIKSIMLNVGKQNVIMLNVVAPIQTTLF
jgi:hypothetical protein